MRPWKRGKRIASWAAVPLAWAVPGARATPWITLGPRAMGMGGAQVAVAEGPLAAYWNPAGAGGFDGVSGLAMPVSARGEFAGSAAQGALDVNQLAGDCKLGRADCTAADINSALASLGQAGSGVLADAGAAAAVRIGRVVVFYDNLTYVGVTPKVDLVPARATPVGLPGNQSTLILRDGNFSEIGASCALPLGETGLTVGGGLKAIVGRIGRADISITGEDPDGAGISTLIRSTRTSLQPGMDLGLQWEMSRDLTFLPWRTRLGVVGRDLNDPTFSQPAAARAAGDRSRFSLQGQVRAGAAVEPSSGWTLAVDADLTDNLTAVEGYKSRFVSAGAEWRALNLGRLRVPLRLGAQKNVSSGVSALSCSGGFGLEFKRLSIDLAAMLGLRRTTLQTQDESIRYPNNVAVAAQLSIPFGTPEQRASTPRNR